MLRFLSLVLNPWDSFSLPYEGLRTTEVKMALCVVEQIPKLTRDPVAHLGLAEFSQKVQGKRDEA